MLFAFIDESYTADRYYVAAIVVDSRDLTGIRDALNDARRYASGFGVIKENVEYHAHSIMTGSDGWQPIKGQTRAAIAIYADVLRRLAGLPLKLIVRGVDIGRLNARYRYPEPPHQVTLRHLLEQVNDYAWHAQDVVTVIADEIADQADHAIRAERYQTTGTGGFRSSKLQQIEMPIVFGPSHQSPGIQAVDLAVYLFRRLDAHTEKTARTAAKVTELWRTLDPLKHHIKRWDP